MFQDFVTSQDALTLVGASLSNHMSYSFQPHEKTAGSDAVFLTSLNKETTYTAAANGELNIMHGSEKTTLLTLTADDTHVTYSSTPTTYSVSIVTQPDATA